MKAVKKSTRLALFMLCCALFLVGTVPVSAAGDNSPGFDPDSIIPGKPVTDMDEGSYNYVYWQARISGSPTVCWIELDYNTTASSMAATLTIPYSSSWLQIQDGTHILFSHPHNTDTVYCFWQDGTSTIALSCSGTASINGTQVTSMGVGWSYLK